MIVWERSRTGYSGLDTSVDDPDLCTESLLLWFAAEMSSD